GCGRGNGGGGGGGYYGGGGGAAWPGATPGANPTGGSQAAGGAGGVSSFATAAPGNNGQPGVLGVGGNGGVELTSNQAGNNTASVGASGGGLTGTTGTYSGNFTGQSGAGGSSFYGTLVNGSTTPDVRAGNGQVVITFPSLCPSASRLPVTFVVNPLPTVTVAATPALAVCEGAQVTLAGNGAVSYSWSGPVGISDNVPFTATQSASGSYVVIGTDANNCSNSDTINLTVNMLPVISVASADSVVCAGDTVMLTASGATAYNWSTGGNAAMEMFAAVATGYTTVTGTDTLTGCSSVDSIMTTVNPLPVIVLTPSNSDICLGSTGSITASGGSFYLWNTGDSTSTINISPSVPTVYAVTVTTPDGCTGSDSISIGVNIPPSVTATASQSVVCAGASVTLTGAGANSWLWSTGGTQITEVVTPSATTTYTVTGTNTVTNCSDTGLVTITVNQLPVVTAAVPQASVCIDDASFTIQGGSPAGGSWSGPGVGANIFSPLSAGLGTHTLVYTYTDNNQCTANASDLLVVSACVGITENSNAGGVHIYPNPASTTVNIRWNEDYRVNRIELTDLTGRIVLAVPATTANSLQIDLNTLPQGIYNLQVVTADGMSTHRIVKQ
ncbi:MAG: T9SS type A sorting domain-containing protein, partial [Bacteroidetes bacterium]|nr:T9SS type A sorting domain-containing protein [Bacteroidota bacterium]